MTTTFSNHFGSVASTYAAARPTYPAELFEWLAKQCVRHDHAWDCATGSGQAATGLADHFARVTATDASAEQIAAAHACERVDFRVASAEASGLGSHSIDLVTIAQALHWFDLDRFYDEVRRVVKRGGVIAAWTYGVQQTDDAAIDVIVRSFYADTLGSWLGCGRVRLFLPFRNL